MLQAHAFSGERSGDLSRIRSLPLRDRLSCSLWVGQQLYFVLSLWCQTRPYLPESQTYPQQKPWSEMDVLG